MGSTMAWLWGRGDKHHLGTGWLWWLCHHHVLSPCVALLWFFFSYRASKAGVLPGHAPRDGILALAPPMRTEREVPSPEGTQLEMAAPGRCRDTHLSLP